MRLRNAMCLKIRCNATVATSTPSSLPSGLHLCIPVRVDPGRHRGNAHRLDRLQRPQPNDGKSGHLLQYQMASENECSEPGS